ncbi:MAG: choice-of-anchor D domain-containing protein [Deltaproteobacteria bacterium]|nr:choice-of-anchor D domain-containing protein [Deltaproteobacteria bacterium]
MTTRRWGALAAILALAACSGENGTYLLVKIEQGTAPAGITKVDLALAFAGQGANRELTNGGTPLTFPLTAAFEIGTGAGDLVATGTAYAGALQVAQGAGSTAIVRGETRTVTITLSPNGNMMPGPDGGAVDADPTADAPTNGDGPDAMKAPDAKLDTMPMPGVAFLVANRASVDFGATVVGMNSPTVSIKITNNGGDVSGSLAVSLTGSLAFQTANDVCSGKGLKPQESCTAGVVFSPNAAGGATGALLVEGMPGGKVKIDLAAAGVAAGALQVSPAMHSFADLEKDKASGDFEFTIANTGGTPTGVLAVALAGSDAQDFKIAADACSNVMVPSTGTCKVAVKFSPKSEGNKTATLTVTGMPGGTAVASLDGKALAPAAVQITPDTNNFGSVVKGQKGGAQAFVLTNKGGVTSAIPVATITDPNFILGTNTCTAALAPTETCSIQVVFAPSDVGGFTGTLDVTVGGLKTSAALSGTGLLPGSLEITPSSQNFDPTVVGAKSATKTFTVKNAGGASTGALTGMLTGSATAEFPVAANNCANKALAPNETCTIVIQLQPAVAGTRSASLAVSASPGGSVTAQMNGVGLAPAALSLSPAGQAFGSVVTGGSVDKTFTVTNTGDVATGTLGFNVTGAQAGEFAILAGAAGDCIMATTRLDSTITSCQLRVRFTPGAVGARTATLNVSASPGGAKSANMDGAGLAQGQMQANASSKDFGLVEVGTSSASFTWKLTNVGGVSTGVPALSSNIPTAYLVTNNCGTAIAPGQSCDVLVSFKPTSGGAQNYTLSATASPGGTAQLALSGRGGYRLTVATTGSGKGTVVSAPSGISCPGTCSSVYDSGTTVTLNASTENGSDSYFTGFTAPGCGGPGASCGVTLSTAPVNASANFNVMDANLVFVSSQAFPSDYGSAGKYDSVCNELASKAGINTKDNLGYVAWMSDAGSVPYKRLDGASGWRRLDGVPVAATMDALLNANGIWNPILLDEYGNDGGSNAVMTGTLSNGDPSLTGTCKEWSTADATLIPTAGDRTFGPGGWTNGGVGTNCGTRNRIYCFGKSKAVTLAHSGAKGKRIYISGDASVGKLFTPGGSIADADAVCAANAPKGAVAVRALLAQDGRSAAGVINPKELYVTPSGERIGQGDQILKASLLTGIWETSLNTFVGPANVYTGATSVTANGDSASTCKNWAGGLLLNGAVLGHSSSTQSTFFYNPGIIKATSCSTARPIYCVEQ